MGNSFHLVAECISVVVAYDKHWHESPILTCQDSHGRYHWLIPFFLLQVFLPLFSRFVPSEPQPTNLTSYHCIEDSIYEFWVLKQPWISGMPHLGMLCNLFNVLLDLVLAFFFFFRNFVYEGYWSMFFFFFFPFCDVFSGFGIRITEQVGKFLLWEILCEIVLFLTHFQRNFTLFSLFFHLPFHYFCFDFFFPFTLCFF